MKKENEILRDELQKNNEIIVDCYEIIRGYLLPQQLLDNVEFKKEQTEDVLYYEITGDMLYHKEIVKNYFENIIDFNYDEIDLFKEILYSNNIDFSDCYLDEMEVEEFDCEIKNNKITLWMRG